MVGDLKARLAKPPPYMPFSGMSMRKPFYCFWDRLVVIFSPSYLSDLTFSMVIVSL